MKKLSSKFDRNMICILGGCHHSVTSHTCPFNKVMDARDPVKKSLELIHKWIKEEIEDESQKQNSKTRSRKNKQSQRQ